VFEVFSCGHFFVDIKSVKFVLPLNYMKVDYDGLGGQSVHDALQL